MGQMAEPQHPELLDISRDTRSWTEVCPDNYLSLEYVGTREMQLHIIKITQEKIGDTLKAVLRFSNEPRGLVLNKTNRDKLKDLFGDSPAAALNQVIVVGLGFVNRNPSLLIKGRGGLAAQQPVQQPVQQQAAQQPTTQQAAPQGMPSQEELQRMWLQQQQAGGVPSATTFLGQARA